MDKNCQSCGMPLIKKGQSQQGTEKDQSLSWHFCHLCYLDGAFCAPEMTMEEMLTIGKVGIQESNNHPLVKRLMIWGYPFQLKKLKRWQA